MLRRLAVPCRIFRSLARPRAQHHERRLSSTPLQRALHRQAVEVPRGLPKTQLAASDVERVLSIVQLLHRKNTSTNEVIKYFERLEPNHPARLILSRDGLAELSWAVAETPRYTACRQLILLAHRLGIEARVNVFEGIIFRLASAGRWSQIPLIVAFSKRMGRKINKRLLNWKTRALIECSEWRQVEDMLLEFHDEGIVPDRRTWNLLVQACLLNSNLPRAREYLAAMSRAGFPPDDSTHVAVLTAYHMLGQTDDVEARAFETLCGRDPKADTAVVNSIMLMRMRHGDLEGMCRVFRVFTVPFNIRMAGVELQLIEQANKTDPVFRPSVEGSYDHVDWTIVTPDTRTFSMLVEIFAHQQEADKVERTFEIMLRCGIQPDSQIVSALIKAYATLGEPEIALMRFLEVCGIEGSARDVARYFHIARSDTIGLRPPLGLGNVPLDVTIYNALLSALLPSCGVRLFQWVLEHMRISGCEPNRKTSLVLLHYLVRRGFTPRELARIATLFSKFPADCRPTIGHINSILAATMRQRRSFVPRFKVAGESDGEEMLLPRLERDAVPYDPSAGLASPENKELNELLRQLVGRQLRSNSSTFEIRLWRDAITKMDMESARKVFQEMKSRGIRPNSRHFTILADGFTRIGDMPAAEGIVDLARTENNVKPTTSMYEVLIRGYGRLHRPERAAHTFFKMIRRGIPPDIKSIVALVDAYLVAKSFWVARHLLLLLWKSVIDFPSKLRRADVWTLRRAFLQAGRNKRPPPRTERDRRFFRKSIAQLLRQWKAFYSKRRY